MTCNYANELSPCKYKGQLGKKEVCKLIITLSTLF